MSILTGLEIKRQVELGNIVIDPFDEKCLNPNSYNFHLSNKLLVYVHGQVNLGFYGIYSMLVPSPDYPDRILDMAKDNPVQEIEIPPTGIILYPGRLFLGCTTEYTETHCFAPVIEGRSSVGRLGVQVHLTAGFGDCKFMGDWTLELTVVHPIRIYAGVAICQIAYEMLVGEQTPYTGKYQGQRGPKASKLWKDFPLK
jgi:dCTP deaminase